MEGIIAIIIIIGFWIFFVRNISNTDRQMDLFKNSKLSKMDEDILKNRYKSSQINEQLINDYLANLSNNRVLTKQMSLKFNRDEFRESFIKYSERLIGNFNIQEKVDIDFIEYYPDVLHITIKGSNDDMDINKFLKAILYSDGAYNNYLRLDVVIIKVKSWDGLNCNYILLDELK